MTREDIKHFLEVNKDKSKEEVLSLFTKFIMAEGLPVAKLGMMISDLQSYQEWIWGQ